MRLAAFDVETGGEDVTFALQPWRAQKGRAWLTCAAFVYDDGYEDNDAGPFPNVSTERIRAHLVYCAENNIRIVGWNVQFDMGWLIALGLRKEVYACKWLDGMLLYKRLTQCPTFEAHIRYGLKLAVEKFLPQYAGYNEDVKFDAVPGTPDYDKLVLYNIRDTRYTLMLAQIFLKKIPIDEMRSILVEASVLPMVAETMLDGLHVDTASTQTLVDELEMEQGAAFVKLNLAGVGSISHEDLRSPTKLRAILYDQWGCPITKRTDTGLPSTDDEALANLCVDYPNVEMIREYREATNNLTKFAQGTLDTLAYTQEGPIVRPQYSLASTYTGRGTFSTNQGRGKAARRVGIPLHQWKREARFRKVVVPPPGYKLAEFDFSGQEFRWMAYIANDATMLSLCRPGEDAHSYMGATATRSDYTQLRADLKSANAAIAKVAKNIRQLGKVANLSLQYMTSARTLMVMAWVQYGVRLTFDEAVNLHQTYKSTYTAMPDYWKQQKRKAKYDRQITNLVGRTVFFHRYGQPFKIKNPQTGMEEWSTSTWSYDATAVNFPIQSMGAEQKYLAMLVLKNELPALGGKYYFELHDGLFVLLPEASAEKSAHYLKHVLSNLPYYRYFGLKLPIQFPVDGKLGDNWGELREI